jgi:hypothetical protein
MSKIMKETGLKGIMENTGDLDSQGTTIVLFYQM